MNDQPDAQALLAQARKELLEALLPVLPRDRTYQALMVAKAMAIAGREAGEGEAARARTDEAIAAFYRATGMAPAGGAAGRAAAPPHAESTLAEDIRRGAFGPEHDAALLELLRRITREKLAITNPKYLVS